MEKILFIVRGLPGSGKSTLAEELVGASYLVCEADKFFICKVTGKYEYDADKIGDAHKYCYDRVKTYMQDSMANDQWYRKIAVSNTFTREREMAPYFELAKQYGYKVFTIIVENRHGGENQHGVPDETMQKMRDRFSVRL